MPKYLVPILQEAWVVYQNVEPIEASSKEEAADIAYDAYRLQSEGITFEEVGVNELGDCEFPDVADIEEVADASDLEAAE
jgi:hypothetical protein